MRRPETKARQKLSWSMVLIFLAGAMLLLIPVWPENLLIVAHGTFNAHLIGELVQFPFDKNIIVSQHNACVNRFSLFTVNGVRRLRFLAMNDVRHLPEELWS